MGDASQGDAQVLAHRFGGERDLQLAGAELGVLVEGLVEVAETEEDDGVGVAPLDLEVLASDRRRHAAAAPNGVGGTVWGTLYSGGRRRNYARGHTTDRYSWRSVPSSSARN